MCRGEADESEIGAIAKQIIFVVGFRRSYDARHP
jgi:hypothetical protein